ncbi:hypothetical protein BLS_006126 [Venturia inaequalis]|uniref:Uncharacterized protein n=1 Tax=Venturia inaequalis TaxID=5025 RepID=A0A8H3UI26_VENIN|nr:hypothetical protein BLS_006126 [Venturia inaequalis]KAE9969786.1 hypothetical protein EG327_010486 [Venturia inaequalis]
MRFSRKPRRTVVGLLSLSGQASAVALSDFTPKATNLPAQCNTIYTQEIPGCTFDDFQKAVCSKACLEGLVEMNALVSNNCQAADVAETSIVGLFKIGKAIQYNHTSDVDAYITIDIEHANDAAFDDESYDDERNKLDCHQFRDTCSFDETEHNIINNDTASAYTPNVFDSQHTSAAYHSCDITSGIITGEQDEYIAC